MNEHLSPKNNFNECLCLEITWKFTVGNKLNGKVTDSFYSIIQDSDLIGFYFSC